MKGDYHALEPHVLNCLEISLYIRFWKFSSWWPIVSMIWRQKENFLLPMQQKKTDWLLGSFGRYMFGNLNRWYKIHQDEIFQNSQNIAIENFQYSIP